MHDSRAQTELRLRRFTAERIQPALYRARTPLTVRAWQVPGEPVQFANAVRADFQPLAAGDAWGPPWGTTWLKVTGVVPPDWGTAHGGRLAPDVRLEAVIDLGFSGDWPGFQAEGLAYTPDGRTIKGIAPMNQYVGLDLQPGGEVELLVEAASNPRIEGSGVLRYSPTALGDVLTAGTAPLYRLGSIDLALLDVTVWKLSRDIEVLAGLMTELPVEFRRRAMILRALEKMMDVMDPQDVAGTAAAGRRELAPVLASRASASAHHLRAVGHSHIDSAWLWPVRETVRKCARTFSTVLELMDHDDDFVFACSSAQQFAWIKQYYPDLFVRIRAKVAAGRFVPVGGMWVESDTNMPGGEAMARQFVAGKRFFLTEFEVDCPEVWLPDSFGYSAALPQIARAAGARYFLTQKLSWNQTNRMPHHTFWWQGIDGSRIFTHFPPVDTYNSQLLPGELAHAERTFAEHGRASMSLVPFGFGDGGGGPTREMIGRAHRVASLDGSPTLAFGSPADFFADAQQDYPDAPTWVGEMYLELHRGTYTSQARTKSGNRRSEHLLREAELWATVATVRHGLDYPYDRLEKHWHTVLLQQFHDILPGSAIAWVYRVAEQNYAEVAADLEKMITGSITALAGGSGENAGRVIEFNAAPHLRCGVPALGGASPAEESGQPVVTAEQAGTDIVMDNGLLRVVVDGRGLIVSLVDVVTGREAIAPGCAGNLLQLHRDIPNEWDAWDVDEHDRHHVVDLVQVTSLELAASTNDCAAIRVTRAFGSSTVVQEILLARGSDALDLVTNVDWHERQKLLKLSFPLDVQADRFASETQFGHVFRPTHTNTSWEAAKFEICAHRWIHVGEPGFGVAITNDRTYGHDVTTAPRAGGEGTTTTVRLSLLRAPVYPDPHADQGEHVFRMSVLPGADIAEAIRAGYRTNVPRRSVRGSRDVAPIVTVKDPAVVVEAVKLAEDRSGDIIVRLYESLGTRVTTAVTAGFPASTVEVTDLLERPLGTFATTSGNRVTLTLRPFEIRTLRFARG